MKETGVRFWSGGELTSKEETRAMMKLGKAAAILSSAIIGLAAGGVMAAITVPAAYIERGYWAIGGEWLAVVAAAVMASTLVYPKMRRVFCQEGKRVKECHVKL